MPSDGLQHEGWRISCSTGPISREATVDAIKARLGPGVFGLPEQLFGDNHLTLRHEASGLTLSFTALGALLAWRRDRLPPVKVPVAEAWRRSHARQMEESGAVELKYDWTFSTTYAGDLELRQPPSAAAPASQPEETGPPGVAWEESGAPLNRAPLLARDPILFYADVPLYASELDDNGACQLSVKVRVMPRCWLALLRCWLRVDGRLVRLREARYLGELLPSRDASPAGDRQGEGAAPPSSSSRPGVGPAGPRWRLTRELKCSEGSFEELQASGAPGAGASYADADSTALALQAVAPVGVTLFRTEACRLLEGP